MKQAKTPKVRRSRARPGAVKGRPTKFSPKITEAMHAFFRTNPQAMLVDFAKSMGLHRDTLHNWSRALNMDGSLKWPEFAQAYTAVLVLKPEAKP